MAVIGVMACGSRTPPSAVTNTAEPRSGCADTLALDVEIHAMPRGGYTRFTVDERGHASQLAPGALQAIAVGAPEPPPPEPVRWTIPADAYARLRRELAAIPLDALPESQRAEVRDGLAIVVTWTCGDARSTATASNAFPIELGAVMTALHRHAYPDGAPAPALPTGDDLAAITKSFAGVPVHRKDRAR